MITRSRSAPLLLPPAPFARGAAAWLLAACAALAPAAQPEDARRVGAAERTGAAQLIRAEHAPMRMRHGISLRDAVTIIRQAYGGRVVSAHPTLVRGLPGYRVRIDISGTVRTVFVDARGRILERAW